jgi:hypothetical protein
MHDLPVTNSGLPLFALDDVDVVAVAVGIGVEGDYLGAHFGRVFEFVGFLMLLGMGKGKESGFKQGEDDRGRA